MRTISTTIKKEWMEKILSGEKKIEFKGGTEFWLKRLKPLLTSTDRIIINFLCGRKSYKYTVLNICHIQSWKATKIDTESWYSYFEIHLGGRIS